jgi:phosphatidylglycerol:prolipoprotein diacylglycerol transferase
MGVFLALAFFWGCFLIWRLVRLSSFKEDDMFDALFNSLLAGLFGGRLVYVILNFKDFGFDILKFILVNGYPGFSLYGMLGAFFLTLYLWANAKKVKFSEMVDYYIPSVLLAIAIGKLGGFFSGAEAGTKTGFFLSIKYTALSGMRHLTPLYESILFFLSSFIAYRLLFETRKEHYKKGFVFKYFLFSQGLIYFLFDNLKEYRLYFLGRSFNQIVSLVLVLTFGIYFLYYFRSLIGKRANHFKNFVVHYVKKTVKNFHQKSKNPHRG